jgi:membrane-bound lytic murein transglycosylase A
VKIPGNYRDGARGGTRTFRVPVLSGLFLALIIVVGCATKPAPLPHIDEPERSHLVLVDEDRWPDFTDDMGGDSLRTAIDRSLIYYNRLPEDRIFRMGDATYSLEEMKDSLLLLRNMLESDPTPTELRHRLRETFDLYQSLGQGGDGSVLFTGYYEPILRGSREKTDVYRYPIYRTPDDHRVIHLGRFHSKYEGERIIARIEEGTVLPYFTRGEIDIEGRLEGRELEIVWTDDPVDLFFMHIQGSGTIVLDGGEVIQVSYDQANGRAYRSLGRHLARQGVLTLAAVSLQGIRDYLRSSNDMMTLMAHNESYIFFRVVDDGPRGALDVTITAGRTIATDPALFPRGGLALVTLKKPVINRAGRIDAWVPFSRLVLNQDAGGAIKGPGRVDLFFGTGDEAGLMAGYMKEYGTLYFLVKKR